MTTPVDQISSYRTAFRRQIEDALRAVFNSTFPDTRYRDIYVGWEFPLQRVDYPAIYINFAEGPISSMGVGHVEIETDDFNTPILAKHSAFSGRLNFNILALNPEDRDNLADELINILQFGRILAPYSTFWNRIEDARYIQLQFNAETIQPSGETQVSPPWQNQDELLFGVRYSIDLVGDFYSSVDTGELITVSDVELYPYRPDQTAPW